MDKTRFALISTGILIVLIVVGIVDYSVAFDLSKIGLPIGLKGILQILLLIFGSQQLSKEFHKEFPTSEVFRLSLKTGLILLFTFFAHLLILQQLGYISSIFPATYSPMLYFLLNSLLFGFFGFILSIVMIKRLRRSSSSS